MKLVTFTRLGRTGFGAVVENGINSGVIDLTEKFGPEINSIKRVIELELLPQLDGYLEDRVPDYGLSDITLLPTIPCLLYTSPSPRDS